METAVVIKTNLVDVTIDLENLPLIPTHDPISNRINPIEPITVGENNSIDNQIKMFEATLGQADAISVNLGGEFVFGGGVTGGANITTFTNGKDAGGVFLYSADGPSPAIGVSAGGGVEVGAVFAAPSTASRFDRYTIEGRSVNVSGGYGPVNGTVSVGIRSLTDWTPTSYTVSVGTGFSSLKVGGSVSTTNTILQSIIKEPKK